MSISEIIETFGEGDDEMEVCASADAQYDPAAQKICVALNSFARLVSPAHTGEQPRQPWLPPAERVSEHLPRSEAAAFTNDVFQSWVKKVRAAIPKDLHPTFRER